VDPHAILELEPGAGPADAARAYRRLAKRFHPDRAGEEGAARMAEVNAAYELLRAALRSAPARPAPAPAPSTPPAPAGHWLPEAVRRALGRELLVALEEGEAVELVTPAATWASPDTLLAVTDRRLLWLLDDAVTNRVRSLRLREIVRAEQRLTWPRRRRARLLVASRYGRPWTFADLRPATARAIAGYVRDAQLRSRAVSGRGTS
jgi:hypothetical protein